MLWGIAIYSTQWLISVRYNDVANSQNAARRATILGEPVESEGISAIKKYAIVSSGFFVILINFIVYG